MPNRTQLQNRIRRRTDLLRDSAIDLSWTVGEIISRKIASAEWGDAVVPKLAAYLARMQPGLRGVTHANLFRMRQFYEAYREDKKVAPLVRQISWTHHLLILSQSKQPTERDFYLQMMVREGWSKRTMERQMDGALFARVVLRPPKVVGVSTPAGGAWPPQDMTSKD